MIDDIHVFGLVAGHGAAGFDGAIVVVEYIAVAQLRIPARHDDLSRLLAKEGPFIFLGDNVSVRNRALGRACTHRHQSDEQSEARTQDEHDRGPPR